MSEAMLKEHWGVYKSDLASNWSLKTSIYIKNKFIMSIFIKDDFSMVNTCYTSKPNLQIVFLFKCFRSFTSKVSVALCSIQAIFLLHKHDPCVLVCTLQFHFPMLVVCLENLHALSCLMWKSSQRDKRMVVSTGSDLCASNVVDTDLAFR